jgi:hypothetical protein
MMLTMGKNDDTTSADGTDTNINDVNNGGK